MYHVNLIPTNDYQRNSYGILLRSETEHNFAGPRIHNRHHGHVLQVWENRPDRLGALVDPHGKPTTERYSFLWTAQATVISAHPGTPKLQGPILRLGDVLELRIQGFSIGYFQCRARSHYDPHLVQVDTASSASCQHYIETGEYLALAEAQLVWA